MIAQKVFFSPFISQGGTGIKVKREVMKISIYDMYQKCT